MSLTFALQALLARYEAFVLEAEDERFKMSASIGRLETDKKELEAANAKTIKENRDLLDQLEDMNDTIANCDAHIQSLTATLQSTRNELERLTVLATRTSELESQLSVMESEQAILQEKLASKEEDRRTALQRWKNAERTIGHLREQVDRIEREAIDERQRHVEVVSRLERRRSVERELETAAGRLKGAAAATTLGKNYGGSSVVSHFVKDILQDNANLQMGVVELRDMLMESNAEVENLREQMMLHQPLAQSCGRTGSDSFLKDELAQVSALELAPELAPELHVHHHYHPSTRAEKGTKERLCTPLRRPKKKRNFASSGLFTPPSGVRTPRTPSNGLRIASPSSASTVLSQTSVSIPPALQTGQPPAWPVQSPLTQMSVAPSSAPSSPQSAYRSSSIFDYFNAPLDSSRPTSPESISSESPLFPMTRRKRGSDKSQRSFSTPTSTESRISGVLQTSRKPSSEHEESPSDIDTGYFDHATILEEPEDGPAPDFCFADQETTSTTDSSIPPLQSFQPTLRRSASHESILSIKEALIPTLRSQHSQLLTRHPMKSRTSLSITSSRIEPVISSMSASVSPSLQARGQDSRDYNRSILSGVSSHSHDGPEKGKQTFGKRVGGWVWGKWGVAPMASETGSLTAKAAGGVGSVEERFRATESNQTGKAGGLGPPKRATSNVEVEGIDERLLKESLGDG